MEMVRWQSVISALILCVHACNIIYIYSMLNLLSSGLSDIYNHTVEGITSVINVDHRTMRKFQETYSLHCYLASLSVNIAVSPRIMRY